MKKIILLLTFFSVIHYVKAQDEAIFNHYTINPILINPAYAGFSELHQLHFYAKSTWTGFPDAPKTYGAMYNGSVGKTFGFGMGILTETAAQITRIRVQLNYAFRFVIKENWKISTGFSTEFQQMTVGNEATNSPFYQAGDQLLEDALNGDNIFDASLGVYGTFRDKTFFGLSFANLVRARLDDIVTNGNQQSFFQYYLFNFGHEFDIIDLNFTLEPSILIRQIRDAPFQIDFNLKAGFLQDQLVAGISYRSLGSLGILLGTKLSSFNLFYSYDISFQEFQQFNMGSHEVTVAIYFKKKNKAGKN